MAKKPKPMAASTSKRAQKDSLYCMSKLFTLFGQSSRICIIHWLQQSADMKIMCQGNSLGLHVIIAGEKVVILLYKPKWGC